MDSASHLVRFRVADVFAPPAPDLMASLYADRVLEGEVVSTATHREMGVCVVVKIDGCDEPVIVAMESLL